MTVKKDAVVEMHYTLKNDSGSVIDSSEGKGPMPFIQGHGNIIPGLESALEGMKIGESCDISVKPEEAYGVHHPEAIQEIPMEALKGIDNLEVGMELQSQDEKGNPFIVHIKEINKDTVTVDVIIRWQVKHCTLALVLKILERPAKKSWSMAMYILALAHTRALFGMT